MRHTFLPSGKPTTVIACCLAYCLIIMAAGRPDANMSGCWAADVAPWTDPNLSVRSGLRLWLDASRLDGGSTENGGKVAASGTAVAAWRDGASQLVLSQKDAGLQPKRLRRGDAWVVRFDGADDYLRCTETAMNLNTATLFIVASPHSNAGEFRGIFAANAAGERDYESGLTIDQGPSATPAFDQLNIEGRGFGGAAGLLKSSHAFSTLHTIQAVIDGETQGVRLSLDGRPEGTRPFSPSSLSFDQLTVGARYYTNGPGDQQVRGPFAGDIAEIILFDRVLTDEETIAVNDYLNSKYQKLKDELLAAVPAVQANAVPLVRVPSPSPITMLMPGFTVREIPLQLTNVNNVRFRADGKLVTLGYNGDLHLLSDTDNDGLEDTAEVFWKNTGSLRGPIGMLLTPPDYAKGEGVFVPSKGKVSLIVDTNNDDEADEEIVVADGWKEIPQNVDAVGIAMDRDGSLYFGIGTANYANGWLVDDAGIGRYDLKSDRGTVQKVSPDFTKREIVCTGIRFPIAFAFNQHGDLFCTEQEGATWLSNGNPFDELLHIQPKRHYGFPPRHPRHNPNVIDEPSTYDYSPQHQSTCGMVFNESVNGGPVFGPAAWAGDAIVCGESRGKIWRTSLIKTPPGYVASSQLIACLQLLTVDACVAPDGDLVVACHSGPPDWGTGPAGIGRLFRIEMSEPHAPRPVMTWAESPQEIRIAFDNPLDPLTLNQLSERIHIEYGDYVRAGDRYEHLIPPYAVVKSQLAKPRYTLPVNGATVTSDLRTLIVSTDLMKDSGHYSVTIGRAGSSSTAVAADSSGSADSPDSDHRATTDTDVDFSLNGVMAEWAPAGSKSPVWSGWLPHPDPDVSRKLLAGSAGHDALWPLLSTAGRLTLRTRVSLRDILRPAVQPGSSLDYEWPPEIPALTLVSRHELVVAATTFVDKTMIDLNVVCSREKEDLKLAVLTVPADLKNPVDLVITLETDGSSPELHAVLTTNEDPTPRPVPLHRFQQPWVTPGDQSTADDSEQVRVAELQGGSWARGRRVFHSEAAGCFKCHTLGGGAPGGGALSGSVNNASARATIGPDLGNLIHRDYASVLRDVSNPGFAINPDYISHIVALNDGRVLTGVLQTQGDALLIGDEKGTVTRVAASDVETLRPSSVSVMPTGIAQKLSGEQLKDLLTYLLTKPPHMPLNSPLTAPPVRTTAEVAAALADAPKQPLAARHLNIVLVDGPKDHGPGEHDYPAWKSVWEELLSAAENATVSTATEFPSDEQLQSADVVIFFQKGSFEGDRPAKLDKFLQRGGGAVYIHWAVNGNDQALEFSQRIGLASWGGRISFRHGPLTLDMHNTDHPILRNFHQIQLYDESYWKLTGRPEDVTLLASSTEDNIPTPQMWVKEAGRGRVFVSIPGHYSWTFDDPLFRILLLRGIAWSAREPVDRFNDLVVPGSRMSR